MRSLFTLALMVFLVPAGSGAAAAASILYNGSLDRTTDVAVGLLSVPKPEGWVNEGFRTISGAFEGEMSSEPWAGPAPTPVTAEGTGLPYGAGGCNGLDCGVFFRPFTGNTTDGAVTAHLYQDNAAVAGLTYTLTGWAGAEANALGQFVFALEFFDAANTLLAGNYLDLNAAGLYVVNGLAFNYKAFTITAPAPVGTAFVRARASMLNGTVNAAGGGQAFVVDDFTLTDDATVPEPVTAALMLSGLLGFVAQRRRRQS